MALRLYGEGRIEVEQCDLPRPGPGQVLVKVECAPLNPSDVYFLNGLYESRLKDSVTIKIPFTPGWEGAGTVIESGGGWIAWSMIGKRVAVSKCEEPNMAMTIGGCYQQYMVTEAL